MTDVLALIDPIASTVTLADLGAPQLPVEDLSAHRGDGIFETVLVTISEADPESGTPTEADQQSPPTDAPTAPRIESRVTVINRERHFARFCTSAASLDLPEPDPALWNRALDTVIAEVRAMSPDLHQFGLRYTLSRGADAPRGWAFPVAVGESIHRARRDGVRAVSLDRGFDAYIGNKAPWLLLGAKTLSYAVNQAAGRHAAAAGVEEALFVSHDGIVLEGPTANIIIRHGTRLLTPDPAAGLLSGTTQRLLFDHAAELGLTGEYADLRLADIFTADGAWLVSSIRTAVAVTELDGNALAVDAELTQQLQKIITVG